MGDQGNLVLDTNCCPYERLVLVSDNLCRGCHQSPPVGHQDQTTLAHIHYNFQVVWQTIFHEPSLSGYNPQERWQDQEGGQVVEVVELVRVVVVVDVKVGGESQLVGLGFAVVPVVQVVVTLEQQH